MEHSPQLPAKPEATAPNPNAKRAAFFERWKKRRKTEAQQPSPEAQPKSPEAAPVKPERKSFGKNILSLLQGDRPQPEAQQTAASPEAQPAQPQTPEQTPQYDRATRMRRLARVIIANVLGQVNQEPQIAKKHGEAQVNTQPLIDATQNLQSAANTLANTVGQAQATPAASNAAPSPDFGGWSGSAAARPERSAPPVEQVAAERIDRRLRRLEAAAEEHRSASVAAVGFGVLAVFLTGAEYFARKRADRKVVRQTSEQFAEQQKTIDRQRVEFNRLRQEHPAEMNRNERRDYYERLSTFTNKQAERTRGTERELREVVITHTPEVVRTELVNGEIFERTTWQPRQPERTAQADVPRTEREPQPLARVEKVERTEQQPGRQTGSAGTGFFGGGGGGIGTGTGPSDLAEKRSIADPNSPEARKLEALRRAEQARLQQNAWLYGAALIVGLGVALLATIFIG